jgi:hypothetical protein
MHFSLMPMALYSPSDPILGCKIQQGSKERESKKKLKLSLSLANCKTLKMREESHVM